MRGVHSLLTLGLGVRLCLRSVFVTGLIAWCTQPVDVRPRSTALSSLCFCYVRNLYLLEQARDWVCCKVRSGWSGGGGVSVRLRRAADLEEGLCLHVLDERDERVLHGVRGRSGHDTHRHTRHHQQHSHLDGLASFRY